MPLTARKPTQETVDIVAGLGGQWHGNFAMCRCPAHTDRLPSLSIRQGDRGLLVHCFAGCRSEDILREIGRSRPIRNSPQPDFSRSQTRGIAQKIWEEGGAVSQTLAEAYLQARNLHANLDDVRFHARCPFGRKPNTVFRPALLVAVREDMTINAIQRIKLTCDGLRHDGKMMLGNPGAAAWAPRFQGSVLAIAESMEDAGAYTRMHDTPCWSSLGAERLPLVRIPGHVDELIIAEDNNRAGRMGALAAIKAHAKEGRRIRRHPPPRGWSDWSAYLDHSISRQR
ncbi:toprim domain-containing protein [Erythrobacteraceae bacterium E2-1 Yellow Sea]|nr:toprim domain-containing protein [Erythrobacteraceae bacterium E2-1 Yellow Sea]